MSENINARNNETYLLLLVSIKYIVIKFQLKIPPKLSWNPPHNI